LNCHEYYQFLSWLSFFHLSNHFYSYCISNLSVINYFLIVKPFLHQLSQNKVDAYLLVSLDEFVKILNVLFSIAGYKLIISKHYFLQFFFCFPFIKYITTQFSFIFLLRVCNSFALVYYCFLHLDLHICIRIVC